jgi:prepilin-type N-terminal cleavage/methylation domain-containing protein
MLTGLRGRARRVTRDDGQHSSDAGFTLTELIVTGVLMSIVMAMALTFFVQFTENNSALTDQNISTASARNVLQVWAATLRLADSPSTPGTTAGRIMKITPTEIEFYADLGNRAACSPTCSAPTKPTQVDLSLNADGQLVQAYYQYNASTGSYPSTPTSSTVMANGVVAADWLFLPYVDADPPAAARPQACNGGAGLCGASAQAELDSIVQVDINFAIAAQGNEKVQSFTTSAALNRGSSA